jgi:branched-chain amino acid transport system permease protein
MIDISSLADPLVNGILWGGLFALIGMGLSLVFGVMNLINVAHGDLVILTSYFAFLLSTGLVLTHNLPLDMDPILSLVIIIPAMFGLGFAIQKFLLNRAFAVSAEAPLIIAFGISLIIQNTALKLWSPMSRSLMPPYTLDVFVIGPLRIRLVYLIAFVAALIVVFLLREFLRRTYLGRAISATAQNKKASLLMGINTGRVYSFAFAIAMAVAAVAGVCLGLIFSFTPTSGISFLLIAFGVVIIGGLGSMVGTLLGGIIMGLVMSLGGFFLNLRWQMLLLYLVVIVVLAARPRGIFGR